MNRLYARALLFTVLTACARNPATSPTGKNAPSAAVSPAPPPKALIARDGEAPIDDDRHDPARRDEPSPAVWGRCWVEQQGRPLWEVPGRPPTGDLPQVNYGAFRKKRSIWVGQSSLSIADFFADEERVFAVSEIDNRLRVYETRTGKLLTSNPIADYQKFGRGDLARWPDSNDPWQVVFGNETKLALLDATTAAVTAQLSAAGAWELDWSADESLLAAAVHAIPAQTSRLAFYSVDRNRLTPTLTVELMLACTERVDAWRLNRAKDRLLLNHYPSGVLTLVDLRNNAVVWSIAAPEYTNSVDWSPDGTQIAVGGAEVWLIDATDPGQIARYTQLGNNVHRVRFSPNGEVLAVSAYDGHARLLSTNAGAYGHTPLRLVKDLRHNGTANVYAVAWTRDGKTLLTSSGDQTLAIWGE